MSNLDIQAHELADLRRFADKAPFDIQQKFHALLNAYEDAKKIETGLEEARNGYRDVQATAETLKKLTRSTPREEPLSDDAWAERLEDLPGNTERAAAIHEELERARAGEAAALARIQTLEEGISSAVEDLEALKEPEISIQHEGSGRASDTTSDLFHCSCCQRASPNNRTRT